jgi:hypothetical protein
MEIRCQEARCGVKVISLDDRPWHIPCGRTGCYAKRQFWALYLRKLFFRWAWLIAPVAIGLTITVAAFLIQAISDFFAAIIQAAIAHNIQPGLEVGLLLFGIFWLVRAYSAWFGSPLGAGPKGSAPNPPRVGNPYGSPRGGGAQQLNERAEGSRGAENGCTPPKDGGSASSPEPKDVQSPPVVQDTKIGFALAYIRFRRWGRSFLDAAETEPREMADVALNNFLRAAAVGAVHVWGRTHHGGPLERIDQSYWREHTIDRLSLFKEAPFTKRAIGNGRVPGTVSYVDLMTSKVQVEALWPA